MSSSQKLTKKQKKALTFRQRKNAKIDLEDNSIPVMEDQDLADAEDVQTETVFVEETESTEEKKKGKTKESPGETEPTAEKKGRKRKREEVENEDGGVQTATRRFILFVGNLKYTTTKEAIAVHFAKCDPPPSIRLLTPKTVGSKPVVKSKGCAFLEFSHRNALQQALKLHQSELDGRMINVELTAGGGGKGQTRIGKLKERNKTLFSQRRSKMKQSEDDATLLQRPQRFSSTSGIEQPPLKKRTWTVGDVDDGETHRGDKRKSRGKKTKSWGTGANLIPVG